MKNYFKALSIDGSRYSIIHSHAYFVQILYIRESIIFWLVIQKVYAKFDHE